MIRQFLLAVYLFSVIYCFIQIDVKIHQAMDMFLERHPGFPLGKPGIFANLGIYVKILVVSAVPVINILLAWFLENASETILEEVVSDVELKYAADIMKLRREKTDEEIQ